MPTQNYLELVGLVVLALGMVVLGHVLSEATLVTVGTSTLLGAVGYLVGAFRTNTVINNTTSNGTTH